MTDSAPKFKSGDLVVFSGLRAKGLNIKPVEGKLYLSEKNKKPGVMMIRGDKQKMMFHSDGTIYCHAQYGCVLKIKEEAEIPAAKAKSTETVPTIPGLSRLITGQPSIQPAKVETPPKAKK